MRKPVSLSARLKLLTALWVAAALFSIAFTLVLSWRMEGAAAAINDAGSLRMRTYRMAFALGNQGQAHNIDDSVKEFDLILHNLKTGDPQRPLFLPDKAVIRSQMAKVADNWQGKTRPMLLASEQQGRPLSENVLKDFVADIDLLVHLTEIENARNTEWLRLFQTGLMMMVLCGALIMVVLLYAWVIRPINTLREGVSAITQGMFGKQITTASVSEFTQLAEGFNQMSTRLQKLYDNLEEQVERKTQDLALKNHELEMLYRTTHNLHQTHSAADAAQRFLDQVLLEITAAAGGSVRLVDFQRKRMDLVASSGLPENLKNAEQCEHLEECLCGKAASEQEHSEQVVHFFHTHGALPQKPNLCEQLGFSDIAVFSVRHKEQDLGVFTLYFREEHKLTEAETDLLNALCNQLGIVIANIRLAEENSQLAVLQERNLLAQGLHDSIAQTLTFLNLQVQMLESALADNEKEQIQENMNFIKEGVQECYDDVRELLLNFRTKISKKDFPEAVETLIKRFRQQTRIPVDISWQGHGLPLSAAQQLQVIFILQESLSNIRKHAQADHVTLSLQNHQDFVLQIRDNGIGFSPEKLASVGSEHVGIGIMQERARRIHAILNIRSAPRQGTIITLTLPNNKRTAT